MYDMRKERELFRFLESEPLMTPAAQAEFLARRAPDGCFAALDSRETPIHDLCRFPARWLKDDAAQPVFSARPGEYYAFQAVVRTEWEDLLTGFDWEGNFPAPGCINLGGVDCKGAAFTCEVPLKPGRIQPLWFCFDIPGDFDGEISGEITLRLRQTGPVPLSVRISVAGEPLADRGDSEPWRHSRLRWLDSRIAEDEKVTSPYIPLRVQKNAVRGLANRLEIAPGGLPGQISSRLSPVIACSARSLRPVLAAPIAFGRDGGEANPEPVRFTVREEGLAAWESGWEDGGLRFCCEGRMEFDGYQEYRITVTAAEETACGGLSLRIPYRPDTARYWMGLGKRGGLRNGALDWKWDVSLNQDTLWMGDVNAGLMLRLRDEHYRKPDMLIYYHYHPLVLPACWDNGGKGGVRVQEEEGCVLLEAYTGPRHFQKGESCTFLFDLAPTPVKPIDRREHWLDHYYHAVPEDLKQVSQGGANIVNIHHATELNPYINYPFYETQKLADFAERCHQNGLRVKIYDTVKEMTVHMTEFWAMKSLNGEIFPTAWETGESFQGSEPAFDGWMHRMLGEDYMTAWRQWINHGCYHGEMEASVVVAPMSRFNNYFLEGLAWILEQTGIDGLYFDDVAFDRSVMKRIRKILDRDHPGCTLDLHSWNYFSNNTVDNSRLAGWANSMNLYIDNFAFLDRIWFGEGFDYDVPPDSWLVEISGIPFGMMGEMLQNGGNIWRGMVFGMTNRLPNQKDPSGIWKLWQDFGIHNAVMLGWWNPDCPVRTGCTEIPATVYRLPHQSLVALASWSEEDREVSLSIDWEGLELDPEKTVLEVPEIPSFQQAQRFRLDAPIPVPAHAGWVLVFKEIHQKEE